MARIIRRVARAALVQLARGFPIVVVTGPRQAGKTTLVKATFRNKPYASLEDPDVREFADEDPRGFLAQFPSGAVLDEVQRCPKLLSYLQGIVDSRSEMGLYILTGSQQLGIVAGITQSLAGRAATVALPPLSLGELRSASMLTQRTSLAQLVMTGFYPALYDRARKLNPSIWHANYIESYLERDVRQIVNVENLTLFQRFVRICAGRTGQLLNLSQIGSDAGVSHPTVNKWLSVLEASQIIFRLPPYYRNFSKRLVKTPKIYFLDCGLAAHLIGITRPEHFTSHPLAGALFETMIVAELLKERRNRASTPNLFFWRDSAGEEIDLVIEDDAGRPIAVEIKMGQTLAGDWFRPLIQFRGFSGSSAAAIVYGGDQSVTRNGIRVLPWRVLSYARLKAEGGHGAEGE
jgi:predicted AAA+ superfamily ATPase